MAVKNARTLTQVPAPEGHSVREAHHMRPYTVVALYTDIAQVWIEHVEAGSPEAARKFVRGSTIPHPVVLAVFEGRLRSHASDANAEGLLRTWHGTNPRERRRVA